MSKPRNSVNAFFTETYESLPSEVEVDGRRYALVSTGQPYVMEESSGEWYPSFETLEDGGYSDWPCAPAIHSGR